MKLKTFRRKDGSIIDVMCHKSFNENHVGKITLINTDKDNNSFAFYYNWDEFLKVNKITECFNSFRYFTNIEGKSNTIILENDTIVPDKIFQLAEYVSNVGGGLIPNIFRQFLDLSKSSNKEGYDKYLYDYIVDNKIKNVFIDSIFKDREQFENITKNVFRWTNGVNILIYSHNILLDILNEYSTDKEIRNTLNMCNVYEIDFGNNIASKIEYDYSTKKFIHESDYYMNFKL